MPRNNAQVHTAEEDDLEPSPDNNHQNHTSTSEEPQVARLLPTREEQLPVADLLTTGEYTTTHSPSSHGAHIIRNDRSVQVNPQNNDGDPDLDARRRARVLALADNIERITTPARRTLDVVFPPALGRRLRSFLSSDVSPARLPTQRELRHELNALENEYLTGERGTPEWERARARLGQLNEIPQATSSWGPSRRRAFSRVVRSHPRSHPAAADELRLLAQAVSLENDTSRGGYKKRRKSSKRKSSKRKSSKRKSSKRKSSKRKPTKKRRRKTRRHRRR